MAVPEGFSLALPKASSTETLNAMDYAGRRNSLQLLEKKATAAYTESARSCNCG